MKRLSIVALSIAATLLAAATNILPAVAADLDVWVDQATVIKLPDRVSTIVVGNPLIADVTLQPGAALIVTGKGYGSTNLVAMDRHGNILMEKAIRVRGALDATVVVYRGLTRETYSCQPNCERRITLGDDPAYFGAALAQTGARSSQAQAGQPAP